MLNFLDLKNGEKLSFSDTNFGRNAWGVPAFGRGPWGQSRVRGERDVIFKFDPEESINDQVSGQPLITTLPAGRPLTGYSNFGENVPMIDNEGWLNSYSAYVNLITYSQNLAGAGWGKTGITWGQLYFRALIQFGGIFQDIAATQNSYTFSFVSYSLDGPGTTLLVLHEFGDGPTTTPLTISAAPVRYDITVPGKTGGGVMRFGLFDPNTSNWQTISFSAVILTETPSVMPYIKTIALPVASPENNSSTDRGNKFPIGLSEPPVSSIELYQRLNAIKDFNDIDSIDYIEQENLVSFYSQNTITSDHSNWAVYAQSSTIDGKAYIVMEDLGVLIVGKTYELKVDVRHIGTGGDWGVYFTRPSTSYRISKLFTSSDTTFETITYRFVYNLNNYITLRFAPKNTFGSGGMYIDNLSIKEVSYADSWKTCSENLIDVFDGAGTEEIVINGDFDTSENWDYTIFSGWNVGSGSAIGTNASESLTQTNNNIKPNTYYEISIDFYSSILIRGVLRVRIGNGPYSIVFPSSTISGVYKDRLLSGTGNLIEITPVIQEPLFTGVLSSISIKQISNAEGELFIEWQPTFNSVDILTNFLNIGAIISQYYGLPNILNLISLLAGPTIFITADDVYQTSLPLSFVKDTIYYCRIIWGFNPNEGPNKMQLIIDKTEDGVILERIKSPITDFSGRFLISEFLSFEYLGLFLNKTRKTIIYNKPQSW